MGSTGNVQLNRDLIKYWYSNDWQELTNAIIDNLGKQIQYKFLRYDVDGNPLVFQNIVVDQSNNPILPSGYIIDNTGAVRDSNGVHIVIVV
jgi:hypothetical protein